MDKISIFIVEIFLENVIYILFFLIDLMVFFIFYCFIMDKS